MKRYLAALALVAVVVCAGYGAWSVIHVGTAPTGMPAQITVALEPNQINSLIYIADERGYFAADGLTVTLKNYSTSAGAVDGMLAGEADVATASEFVLAGAALAQNSARTFACIDKFNHVYILGRNDRGIKNASDLKGKTIGLQRKTNSEFYLGRYLNLHGMEMRDVTIVDIKAPQQADALANGTVDAVVAWQPYATRIQNRLPDGLAVWPAESGQAAYCTAITTDTWLSGHPEPARRFLAALARAETDIAQDPAAAQAIVEKRLHYDSAYVDAFWPEHRFGLSLDESLVAAMQDEARWKVANNLTNVTAVPDFTKYISTTALENVNPAAVRIIGSADSPGTERR